MKPSWAAVWLLPLSLLLSPLAVTPVVADDPPRIKAIALFSGKALLRINGERRLLKVGEAAGGARLVYASSRQAVLEYSGRRYVLMLDTDISARLSEPERQVTRIPSRGGVYVTAGQINGRGVRFLVDTGASSIAMSRPTADRLQIPYREQGEPGWASTASRVQKIWSIQLDTVTVGQITMRQVRAAVIDTTHGEEVLLGMSFLSRVKLIQDEGLITLEAER